MSTSISKLYDGHRFRTMLDSVERAFEMGLITCAERRILGWFSAYAIHALNDARIGARFDVHTIAAYCRMDKRTVKKAIESLLKKNVLYRLIPGNNEMLALNVAWSVSELDTRVPEKQDKPCRQKSRKKASQAATSHCAPGLLDRTVDLDQIQTVDHSTVDNASNESHVSDTTTMPEHTERDTNSVSANPPSTIEPLLNEIIKRLDERENACRKACMLPQRNINHIEREFLRDMFLRSMSTRRVLPPASLNLFALAIDAVRYSPKAVNDRLWREAKMLLFRWLKEFKACRDEDVYRVHAFLVRCNGIRECIDKYLLVKVSDPTATFICHKVAGTDVDVEEDKDTKEQLLAIASEVNSQASVLIKLLHASKKENKVLLRGPKVVVERLQQYQSFLEAAANLGQIEVVACT